MYQEICITISDLQKHIGVRQQLDGQLNENSLVKEVNIIIYIVFVDYEDY